MNEDKRFKCEQKEMPGKLPKDKVVTGRWRMGGVYNQDTGLLNTGGT